MELLTIEERTKEHKLKKFPEMFTAKYTCNKIVYFVKHEIAETALKREEQLKKWKSEWKINLITEINPSWID